MILHQRHPGAGHRGPRRATGTTYASLVVVKLGGVSEGKGGIQGRILGIFGPKKGFTSQGPCQRTASGVKPANWEPKEWDVLSQGMLRNKRTGRIGVTYGVKSLSNILGVYTFNVCEF